jgi:hypothetical protein
MCQKLGIRIIAASTPQAKGRVERVHGVHQDRLTKKLRRQGIASYEAANQYLQEKYLAEHNHRFAREAAEPEDYHRRKPAAWELRQIFRLETERAIGNDWVIRHHGRYLQLRPETEIPGIDKKQSSGMRMGRRQHGHLPSRGEDGFYRASRSTAEGDPASSSGCPGES